MCGFIRKVLASPFKLVGGLLAPGGGNRQAEAAPAEPAVPTRTDATTQAAGDALRRRMTRRQGFASTLLTGGQGVTAAGPTPTAVNTSLGGAG